MAERGSRWERSVLTFGPVGRLVGTVVVLLVPVLLLHQLGALALLVAGAWVVLVVPLVCRDLWRPAALPPTELTRLRDQAAREAELGRRPPPDPEADIATRRAPRRW